MKNEKNTVFPFPTILQNWFDALFSFPDIFSAASYVCDLHNKVSQPTFVTASIIYFAIVFSFILRHLTYFINFSTATESFTYRSTIPKCYQLEQSVISSVDIPQYEPHY